MTKLLAPTLVIGLLFGVVAIALAEPPITVLPGQINFTFGAHVTPKKLPKGQRAGVSVRIDSRVRSGDGSRLPPLEEGLLELDKSIAIDAGGLPACPRRLLEADDTAGAEMDCRTAIVGEGKAEIEVAQPEQAPFPVASKVLAFNAGVAGGKTKLLVFAYLAEPVFGPLVIPVDISRERRGVFGLLAVANVPRIADGYGAITRFYLELGREFTYRGQAKNYLQARCSDRKLFVKSTDVFADGSRLSRTVVRPCIPQAD